MQYKCSEDCGTSIYLVVVFIKKNAYKICTTISQKNMAKENVKEKYCVNENAQCKINQFVEWN